MEPFRSDLIMCACYIKVLLFCARFKKKRQLVLNILNRLVPKESNFTGTNKQKYPNSKTQKLTQAEPTFCVQRAKSKGCSGTLKSKEKKRHQKQQQQQQRNTAELLQALAEVVTDSNILTER